jgi:hypothetical protein
MPTTPAASIVAASLLAPTPLHWVTSDVLMAFSTFASVAHFVASLAETR